MFVYKIQVNPIHTIVGWWICLSWLEVVIIGLPLNSLPDNKFLDSSKLKAFADNKKKKNVTQKSKFVLGKAESIVGKG